MSDQFSHIFALHKKMIVFADSHLKTEDALSSASAKFDAVEMGPTYFEFIFYKIIDLSWFEVQKLQFI